jgi:hypothetical protein
MLELKLEIRKISNNIKKSQVFSYIFKAYLFFIVGISVFSLLNIATSASYNANKAKLVQSSENEVLIEDRPLLFMAPTLIIPVVQAEENNSYYQMYKIKDGETLQTLSARFELKEDSLTTNNPGKEFKTGTNIVKPKSNGYLLGYNKDSNTKDLSQATKVAEDEIKKQKNQDEGYIFLAGNSASEVKTAYETNLTRIRFQIAENARIKLLQSQQATYSSNTGYVASEAPAGQDFSDSMNRFMGNTRGVSQHDGNGGYYGQCVSLVKRWQMYIGASKGVWPGGYPAPAFYSFRAGDRSMAPSNANYTAVVVGDVNALRAGDIVVLVGYPSHTGIATGKVSGTQYELYEQNPSAPRTAMFNKGGFIGALRYIRN